jgi:hypothetical protein
MHRVKFVLFLLALGVVVSASALAGVGRWLPQSATATHALPAGKAQAGAFRFVALGDTGTGGAGQLAIARRMTAFNDERPYNTVLLLGDNVYPDGDPAGLVEKFELPYAELLRRGVSFYAVLGNHDVQRGRAAQLGYQNFNMGGRAYYSFVKGDRLAEFFALDSNQMGDEQLRWLEGALSASKAHWKIVFMHHPLYSSGKKHGSNGRLQLLLEPLFVRYGVAAVFAGHDHVYGRTALREGVLYFVSGTGGQLRRGGINRSSPLFIASNDQVHSFMYVELTRDRLAFWAVSDDGSTLDSGTLNPPPAKEK